MRKKILTLIIGCMTASSFATANNILPIKETITDSAIVYPNSFETDVKAMLNNWYLQSYVELDREADKKPTVKASKEEYIERLGKMPTEIEMPYNEIVRNYIEMYTGRRKQLVENMLGMSTYYFPIFEAALDREGLPLELRYLPIIESALNPTVKSPAGAVGLWQFILSTGREMGLEINSLVDERCDPYLSSDAAAKFLKGLYTTYGDWSLAIAAYNCGPGNVNKAIRRSGVTGKPDFWAIYEFLPTETRGYVPAFIAANYVMNYYPEHGISPALAKRPLITDTIHVTQRVHFDQISAVLDIPVDVIKALNPQYKKNLIPGDIKPYTLTLPFYQVHSYVMSEDSIVNHNADLYARRSEVEPGVTAQVSGQEGEYVTKTVVKYHRVKRGESLGKIAKRYGVTVKSIKKANGLKNDRINQGQRLKIVTTQRVFVPKPQEAPADTVTAVVPADTTIATTPDAIVPDSIVADTTAITTPEIVAPVDTTASSESTVAADVATAFDNNAPEEVVETPAPQQKTKTHVVKRGDTLGKIAQRYGVTINQIKKLNKIKGSRITVGQRLKIPVK